MGPCYTELARSATVLSSWPMRLAIYTDFDGTITTRDSIVTLTTAFLAAERKSELDQAFHVGDRPLWELIDTSLAACGVPLDEAIRYLHANVAIDPTFAAFHAWCAERTIPLEVLSAGVHEIVASFLDAAGLVIPIRANRACRRAPGFGITPLEAACPTGVDKGGIVREAKDAGHFTVYVGDGFSDRLAVKEADLVYAKADLARYCAKRNLPFVPFERFEDVQRDLARRLH